MNQDIRLDTAFLHHPKTLRLERRLGAVGILALLELWCYSARERPTGVLTGLDPADIEWVARWRGEAGQLTTALTDVGFLDVDGAGCYSLHDWETHQPYVSGAIERTARAKKASNARWRAEDTGDAQSNAQPMLTGQTSIPTSNAQSMLPAMPRSLSHPIPRMEDLDPGRDLSAPRTGREEAERLVMRAIPHTRAITANRDGENRTLRDAGYYKARLEALGQVVEPQPSPGALLATVARPVFDSLVQRVLDRMGTIKSPTIYIRVSLAQEWDKLLGELADRAQSGKRRHE